MRKCSVAWGVCGLVGGALAWTSGGCTRDCTRDSTCLPELADTLPVCPDDPKEGRVAETCGVWVSASLGNDGNAGTQTAPVKSLWRAIQVAENAPHRVYACGEAFQENVTLPAGVSLFGGFDCENGWAYVGPAKSATIDGAAGLPALTLTGGDGKSWLGDLNVLAANAVEPGGSSIAVLAWATASAEMRRSKLVAGNGADGADGTDAQHNDLPAQTGLSGKTGANACTMDLGNGGMSVTLHCDDGTVSIGGEGGNGSESFAKDGQDGGKPPDPNPQGFGAGGKGENAAQGLSCTGGTSGAQGMDGVYGLGAIGIGDINESGYHGKAGADGAPGLPGQGGGGGGASFGNALCGAAPHGGPGGGSGGTGGCGGRAGKGGQAGGSSFAVLGLGTGLVPVALSYTTGRGGKGGNGGSGQQGGQGGVPGLGGLGINGVQAGCVGGGGGNGGDGGDGGGGHGGHSLAVAFRNGAGPALAGESQYKLGGAGLGGHGGNPALVWTNGEPGLVGSDYPF